MVDGATDPKPSLIVGMGAFSANSHAISETAASMNLRAMADRFTLRLKPSQPVPVIAASAQTPTPNPYVASHADIDQLTETAETRFEKIYYNHRGRIVFKWSQYLPFYDKILSPLVGKEITLVEIGLARGGSIQLWKKYLGPQIRIVGVDIDPNCMAYAEPGVEILIGDQGNSEFLAEVAGKAGGANVVIDDGSHISSHQILTLKTLFPILEFGGIYICEDLHTSYWPDWGGGLRKDGTFIEYLKTGLDKIHGRYFGLEHSNDEIFNQIGSIELDDSIVALTKRRPQRNVVVEVGGEGA